MRSLFRKMHKGQKGFTLVELLVVFTLMGLLAAITIPSIQGFVNVGEDHAQSMELSIIQTAMDSLMAVEQLSAVSDTTETNNMGAFPDEGTPLFPGYLRYQYSTSNYTCDTTGLVGIGTNNFD